MKIIVLQENLSIAAARAGRAVASKQALPVFTNLLLAANPHGLSITAASPDAAEVVLVGGKTEKEGSLCVPAKLFGDLVATIPAGSVTLEEKGGALLVTGGGARASIAGIPGGEFPPVAPPAGGQNNKAIDKDRLVSALSVVLFAAATDEGRPLLTGVKVVQAGEETVVAATDGYRLSVYRAGPALPKGTDLVISARALGEVVRICHEEKEVKEVTLAAAGDGQLVFVVGDTTVITRRIDGEYPNFEKIIPTKYTTAATLDAAQLAKAAKSASVFARDSANIVRLHIAKNLLTISANTPQIGENTVDVDAKIEGEGGDIAFNSRFLLELLSNFPGEELVFEMTGALNPGVFKSPKDPAFLHLIMPVRTSSQEKN